MNYHYENMTLQELKLNKYYCLRRLKTWEKRIKEIEKFIKQAEKSKKDAKESARLQKYNQLPLPLEEREV